MATDLLVVCCLLYVCCVLFVVCCLLFATHFYRLAGDNGPPTCSEQRQFAHSRAMLITVRSPQKTKRIQTKFVIIHDALIGVSVELLA